MTWWISHSQASLTKGIPHGTMAHLLALVAASLEATRDPTWRSKRAAHVMSKNGHGVATAGWWLTMVVMVIMVVVIVVIMVAYYACN